MAKITYLGYSASGVPDVGVDADTLEIWSQSYVLYCGRQRNVAERGQPRCWGPVPDYLRAGVLETLAALQRGVSLYDLNFPGLDYYVECLASGMTPEQAEEKYRRDMASQERWQKMYAERAGKPPEEQKRIYQAFLAELESEPA